MSERRRDLYRPGPNRRYPGELRQQRSARWAESLRQSRSANLMARRRGVSVNDENEVEAESQVKRKDINTRYQEWKAARDAKRQKERATRKKPFYCGSYNAPSSFTKDTTGPRPKQLTSRENVVSQPPLPPPPPLSSSDKAGGGNGGQEQSQPVNNEQPRRITRSSVTNVQQRDNGVVTKEQPRSSGRSRANGVQQIENGAAVSEQPRRGRSAANKTLNGENRAVARELAHRGRGTAAGNRQELNEATTAIREQPRRGRSAARPQQNERVVKQQPRHGCSSVRQVMAEPTTREPSQRGKSTARGTKPAVSRSSRVTRSSSHATCTPAEIGSLSPSTQDLAVTLSNTHLSLSSPATDEISDPLPPPPPPLLPPSSIAAASPRASSTTSPSPLPPEPPSAEEDTGVSSTTRLPAFSPFSSINIARPQFPLTLNDIDTVMGPVSFSPFKFTGTATPNNMGGADDRKYRTMPGKGCGFTFRLPLEGLTSPQAEDFKTTSAVPAQSSTSSDLTTDSLEVVVKDTTSVAMETPEEQQTLIVETTEEETEEVLCSVNHPATPSSFPSLPPPPAPRVRVPLSKLVNLVRHDEQVHQQTDEVGRVGVGGGEKDISEGDMEVNDRGGIEEAQGAGDIVREEETLTEESRGEEERKDSGHSKEDTKEEIEETEGRGGEGGQEGRIDFTYFNGLHDDVVKDFTARCETWKEVGLGLEKEIAGDQSSPENLSQLEEAIDQIRSTVCQAELLMRKKMKQYLGLVAAAQNGSDGGKTSAEDLQGFWDLVSIQVDDINKKFGVLEELKENGWKKEKKIIKKRGKKRPAAAKPNSASSSTATSSTVSDRQAAARERRNAMRARLKEMKTAAATAATKTQEEMTESEVPPKSGDAKTEAAESPAYKTQPGEEEIQIERPTQVSPLEEEGGGGEGAKNQLSQEGEVSMSVEQSLKIESEVVREEMLTERPAKVIRVEEVERNTCESGGAKKKIRRKSSAGMGKRRRNGRRSSVSLIDFSGSPYRIPDSSSNPSPVYENQSGFSRVQRFVSSPTLLPSSSSSSSSSSTTVGPTNEVPTDNLVHFDTVIPPFKSPSRVWVPKGFTPRKARQQSPPGAFMRRFVSITPSKKIREVMEADLIMSPARRSVRIAEKLLDTPGNGCRGNHKVVGSLAELPDELEVGYLPNKALLPVTTPTSNGTISP